MKTQNPFVKALGVCAAGAAALLVSGCATTRSDARANNALQESSRAAADVIAENINEPYLSKDSPIIVASFVNVDDMTDSSSFGRIVSEQVASRLAQPVHGFSVIELKLRQNIFIKEKAGEFMLSREVKDLTKEHDAQIVVVGTYAIANRAVYVSVRAVNPDTNRIISSYDYNLSLAPNMMTLLGYKRIYRSTWWDRIWGRKDVWGKGSWEYYQLYPEYL